MKNFILLFVVAFLAFSCKDAKEAQVEVISPEQVYEAVYGGDSLQLVDVRTTEEYQVSHLKNAQNICVTNDDFKEKAANLDKTKPVYVYCQKGGRSAKAAQILKEMGFTKVYDLQGGMENWESKDLETIN